MKAELPADEILRLKILHDLAILDSPREQNFDDVAQVAMQLCDVPIAIVSLVDTDRQWFKSCLGLDVGETPRDIAFCAHAILVPNEVMVITDATKDFRFADNALVIGQPHIRFYAGAPLIAADGIALGTLCVIDYKPRTLTHAQISALQALARQVVQLLRLKATNEAMQQYSGRVQLIADKVPILIGELNLERCYIFANQKYQDWLSQDVETVIGKTANDIYPSHSADAIATAIDNAYNKVSTSIEVELITGRVLELTYLTRFDHDNVVGIFEVATDVTERKTHLEMMRQERERLSAIIEGTNIGTWEWDMVNDSVVVNERWATMLGYELRDLSPINKSVWAALLHPDDAQLALESLNNHLK